jgi:hypothetical protein
VSFRTERCDKCGQSHAVYTCDRCEAEIVGVGEASRPFEVVVNSPGGLQVATHLCGACVVDLAKVGVAILPTGGTE